MASGSSQLRAAASWDCSGSCCSSDSGGGGAAAAAAATFGSEAGLGAVVPRDVDDGGGGLDSIGTLTEGAPSAASSGGFLWSWDCFIFLKPSDTARPRSKGGLGLLSASTSGALRSAIQTTAIDGKSPEEPQQAARNKHQKGARGWEDRAGNDAERATEKRLDPKTRNASEEQVTVLVQDRGSALIGCAICCICLIQS